MNVLLVSEYFYPDQTGGTGTVVSELARVLHDEEGVTMSALTSVHLYRGEAPRPLATRDNWKGIRIARLRTPKSNRPSTPLRLAAGLLFTARAFLKLLRLPRPDLLFVVTNPPTVPMAVRLYSRLRRVPYVYLVHDLFPDVAVALSALSKESKLAKLWGAFQRQWLHGAARVIVLGRDMKAHLTRAYGLSPDKIEVITNWSDPTRIVPLPRETRFRAQHGLSGTVVLYAGNFGQYQDFDTLLNAAKLTRDADVTWVFVGEGAKKEYLTRRIADEGISNARMFPFVPGDAFADLLASADLSLVTLEPGAEGLGVPSKFYNILASGRPTLAVVASDSEVAQTLREGDCGVAVTQGRPDELAATVKRLAASPDERHRLGCNARALFEREYTLSAVARHYAQVLRAAGTGERT